MDWGSIIGSAISGAASLAGAALTSKAQSDANKASSDSWEKWAQMFKPTEEEKAAMRARAGERIKKDYLASNRALGQSLAARGLGGGMLAGGLGQNTREMNSLLGAMETDVELFGFGKAPSTPPPSQLGTSTYFAQNVGNTAQYLGGLTLANSLFGQKDKTS